ncbi:MAG TPA: HNH endonuclease [Verrucomicrobiae bacterium]|nr:HNH endonuclease [Verrucomicrobiae bacterium]
MSDNVLVLNRLWQAVNVCSVRRAFTLLCAGHAQVVETNSVGYQTFGFREWQDVSRQYDGHDVVRTISFKIRIPKVIVLLFYDRFPKKEVKFTRQNVFERDKSTCQYCGRGFERKELNLDHVVPRDRGGRMSWENIVCSCVECNTRKGNRTPEEAGMRLIRRPRRPKWRPSLVVSFSKHMDESWRTFLDISYWNVELGE